MSWLSSSRWVAKEWRRVWNARGADGILHCALENGLVEMVAAPLPGDAIHIESGGRKDPVPRPFAPGMRVLPEEGSG
jgi:hypothetical protein